MEKEKMVYVERLNKILLKDKQNFPNKLISVVKSDIENVLNNYFELNLNSSELKIIVGEDGLIQISYNSKARNIIPLNAI